MEELDLEKENQKAEIAGSAGTEPQKAEEETADDQNAVTGKIAEAPKKRVQKNVKLYSTLVLTGFVNALSMHAFIIPNGFVSGGVSGFAMIFAHLASRNTGIFLAALNAPLVVISFFFIGKKFALRTLVSIASSSFFLWLFGAVAPNFVYVSLDTKLLPAAAGGVISGLSMAVVLRNGSSNGGMDVIATIIQKKRADINIAWFILALDMTSIVASVFIFTEDGAFNLEPLILATVYKFVSAKACEVVLEGIKSALKFEIITTHPQEVGNEIMERLHRGVTKLEGTGMYSKKDKALLICVIRRRELSALQRIVKKYPDTFCYISSTSEVMGKF